MMKLNITLFILLFLSLVCQAQEDGEEKPRLGGVDQVDNRMELDKQTKPLFELGFLGGYFDFKEEFKEKTGFSFAVDYTTTYFSSNSDLGVGSAGNGIARIYGSWELTGRNNKNSGALVYKFEHRHKYGEIPMSGLGFDVGYAGLILPPFNDNKFRTTNLYWRQRWNNGKLAMVAGFLDVTDFFDVYMMASPWLHFANFNFSTGVAAVNVPNDAYLGVGLGGWVGEKVYMIAGFGDINSDPTNIFEGFDTFFNENEYFKHVEIGITSSKDYAFLDNIHLSLWHRDETSATGDPDGWGLVLSGTKYINQTWFPFFRFAYTKDAGSLLETAIATGVGYQPNPGSHLLGAGYSWGKVNESTFVEGLDDQHVIEVFYRIQFSKYVALTPDIQYIINPALNDEESSVFLWGIRGRIAL